MADVTIRKLLLAVSDRWKLPLLDGISDYSYVTPLDRATNIDKTNKKLRKQTIYFTFEKVHFPS